VDDTIDSFVRYIACKHGKDKKAAPLTHAKMQQLAYRAQQISLSMYNKPMFKADFYLMEGGVFCPELFIATRQYVMQQKGASMLTEKRLIKCKDKYCALIEHIEAGTPDYFDNKREDFQNKFWGISDDDFQNKFWGISGMDTNDVAPINVSDLILILSKEAELIEGAGFQKLIANNTELLANEILELCRMVQENKDGTDLMKCHINVSSLSAATMHVACVHEYQQREMGEIQEDAKTIVHTAASILYGILHSYCLCTDRLELKIKEKE
jgi:hypothetical protein